MSSSSSSNHLVTNQRNDSRAQKNAPGIGHSTSIAQIYQTPRSAATTSSASTSSAAFQLSNQNYGSQASRNHTHDPHQINSSNKTHPKIPQQPSANYLSKPSSTREREKSMSAALQRLSQHHTMQQQQSNPLLKQRTLSASAISSINTNFHHNHTNLANYSKRIEDLSRLVSSQQNRQQVVGQLRATCSTTSAAAVAATTTTTTTAMQRQYHQHQNQEQLERDNEETTIREEEFENVDIDGFRDTELEALSSLERNLPVELSFLIRQQAYCMARMNYLDRQVREVQELQALRQHHQVDTANVGQQQVSSSSNQAVQLRLAPGHQHQQLFNAQGQSVPMTASKNGNFILSDDSGGEYSRATCSDDDELSSLLDQIAKSVRPDQQRAGAATTFGLPSGQMSNNNISQSMPPPLHLDQQQQMSQNRHQLATADQNQFQTSNNQHHQQPHHNHHLHQQHHHHHHQQQQQQQFAIINSSQLHAHAQQQQAVPIFVMSSPIVPVAHHPSSISSNILPGVHFQPEPRYNQYYEDYYCNGPNGGANVPPALSMMMPARQQQQQPNQFTLAPHNQPHYHHHHNHHHQKSSQIQQSHHHHQFQHNSQQPQFDSSMTAIEQLVSQKEKRQIVSQLKSADNWLKMRASTASSNGGGGGGPTLNENSYFSGSNTKSGGNKSAEMGPVTVANGEASAAIGSTVVQATSARRGQTVLNPRHQHPLQQITSTSDSSRKITSNNVGPTTTTATTTTTSTTTPATTNTTTNDTVGQTNMAPVATDETR